MLDKMDTFKRAQWTLRRAQLVISLKGLLRSHDAAELVDALGDALAEEAKGAHTRRHFETASEFDRIAVDLWAQPERFENEDSGQEEPSYYAEGYESARDRLMKDSGK